MRAISTGSRRRWPLQIVLLSLLPRYGMRMSWTPSYNVPRRRRRRRVARPVAPKPLPLNLTELRAGAALESIIRQLHSLPNELYELALFAAAIRNGSQILSPFLEALELMESHAKDYRVSDEAMKIFTSVLREQLAAAGRAEHLECIESVKEDELEVVAPEVRQRLKKLVVTANIETADNAASQSGRKRSLVSMAREARRLCPRLTSKELFNQMDQATKDALTSCLQLMRRIYAEGATDLQSNQATLPRAEGAPAGFGLPEASWTQPAMACAYGCRRYFPYEDSWQLAEEFCVLRSITEARSDAARVLQGVLALVENFRTVIESPDEIRLALEKRGISPELHAWLWDCYLVLLREAFKDSAELVSSVWGQPVVLASFGTEPTEYDYLTDPKASQKIRSGASQRIPSGASQSSDSQSIRLDGFAGGKAAGTKQEVLWAAQVESVRQLQARLLNLPPRMEPGARDRLRQLDDLLHRIIKKDQDLFISKSKRDEKTPPIKSANRVVQFNLMPQICAE